jgi:hypothetical protein
MTHWLLWCRIVVLDAIIYNLTHWMCDHLSPCKMHDLIMAHHILWCRIFCELYLISRKIRRVWSMHLQLEVSERKTLVVRVPCMIWLHVNELMNIEINGKKTIPENMNLDRRRQWRNERGWFAITRIIFHTLRSYPKVFRCGMKKTF